MKYNEIEYKNQFRNSPLHEIIQNKIVFTSLGEQSYYKGSDLIIEAWFKSPQLNQSDKCVLILAGKFDKIDYKKIENYKNVYIKISVFQTKNICSGLNILMLIFYHIGLYHKVVLYLLHFLNISQL